MCEQKGYDSSIYSNTIQDRKCLNYLMKNKNEVKSWLTAGTFTLWKSLRMTHSKYSNIKWGYFLCLLFSSLFPSFVPSFVPSFPPLFPPSLLSSFLPLAAGQFGQPWCSVETGKLLLTLDVEGFQVFLKAAITSLSYSSQHLPFATCLFIHVNFYAYKLCKLFSS